MFSTVHIYYGSNSRGNAKYRRRVHEIEAVAKYLAQEAKKSDANQILVGDFNIIKHGSDGANALEENGFTAVKNRRGSNKDQTKFYDQISFLSRRDELKLIEQPSPETVEGEEPELPDRVFQFFDIVYREDDFATYRSTMKRRLNDKIKQAEADLAVATSRTAKNKAKESNQGEEEGDVIGGRVAGLLQRLAYIPDERSPALVDRAGYRLHRPVSRSSPRVEEGMSVRRHRSHSGSLANQFAKCLVEPFGDWSRLSIANHAIVKLHSSDHFGGATGQKALVRDVMSWRVIVVSTASMLASFASSRTALRVIPSKMPASTGGVKSLPCLTMKILSPVHSATSPLWFSIRASTHRAFAPSILAITLFK